MTQDQVDKLQALGMAACRVVQAAEGAYVPYELGAAIGRLDDAHSEIWLFIDNLEADEPASSAGPSNG